MNCKDLLAPHQLIIEDPIEQLPLRHIDCSFEGRLKRPSYKAETVATRQVTLSLVSSG